jgi:hypothetical protein
MDTGKPIFAQLMDFLPVYEFHQCVQRYHSHYKMKSFSSWDSFLIGIVFCRKSSQEDNTPSLFTPKILY